MYKVIDGFIVTSKDRLRGTVRTEVYEKENGEFSAFSYYTKDKNEVIIGMGTNNDKNVAIQDSINQLRNDWREAYSSK